MRAADVHNGFTHGRWTILSSEFRREKSGAAWFPARCSCGTEREIVFKGGFQSESCGCLQREVTSARTKTHGQSKTKLHHIWRGMRERCNNPQRKEYPNYGGRGITIDPAWEDFEVFRSWALSNGYSPELDIDRIDNDGPYSPGNCRWVTRKVNLRNTRMNKMLTAFGETKSLPDWADDERCLVSKKTLDSRNRLGWKDEDAISTPRNNWNPERRR